MLAARVSDVTGMWLGRGGSSDWRPFDTLPLGIRHFDLIDDNRVAAHLRLGQDTVGLLQSKRGIR
jgi:hypothetical protein